MPRTKKGSKVDSKVDSKKRKMKEEKPKRVQPKRKAAKREYISDSESSEDDHVVSDKFAYHETQSDEELAVKKSKPKTKKSLSPSKLDDHHDDPISTYEEERLANIRKNSEFLASLGLEPIKDIFPPKQKKQKRVKTTTPTKSYSLRSKGSVEISEKNSKENSKESSEEDSEEEIYTDSNIFQYDCKSEEEEEEEESEDLSTIPDKFLKRKEMKDDRMKQVYCMDYSKKLIGVGGHGGHVTLFGNDSEDPLMSWKAHKGWISSVLFMNQLLITTSNDKSLLLWDLTSQKESQPKSIFTKKYSSGIFSSDCKEDYIVTGLKDGTVGVAQVTNNSLTVVKNYTDVHEGVVKSVCISNKNILGICGNEKVIKLIDTRTDSISLNIYDAHQYCINNILISPYNSNLLLSASYDPNIQLFDIRKPSKPLFTLSGHIPLKKTKNIYKPIFCCEGNVIATLGEKSGKLSLYCVNTGKVISRGSLGFDGNCLGVNKENSRQLALAHNKSVFVLSPSK